MNFAGIFFQLLITGLFCKRGIYSNPKLEYSVKLSAVRVWQEETGDSLGNFESPFLHKYENVDYYFMQDLNDATLSVNVFQDKLFSSTDIEFISMYRLQLIFVFQRANDRVYVLCLFLNENDIQLFFDTINSRKAKDTAIKVDKVAKFTTDNSNFIHEIEPLTSQAELSVRDITESIHVVHKIYYITHTITSDANEIVEADLIFVSGRFSVSALYYSHTIALCVADIPDDRFLIRFSNEEDIAQFLNNYVRRFENNKNCSFPELTLEVVHFINDD